MSLIPSRTSWRGANGLYVARKLGLATNLKLALDFGDPGCYSGSGQTVTDLAGASSAFNLGATGSSEASDPTFNSGAGPLADDRYFSFDGGDWFTYSAANASWMENIHKDNAKATGLFWFYVTTISPIQALYGTYNGNNASIGAQLHITASGTMEFRVGNGSGSSNALSRISTATVSTNAWHFAAWSIDEAVGANGYTFQLDAVQESGISTYTTPSASAASGTMAIGARLGAGTNPLLSGGRVAMACFWEGTNLSPEQLMAFFQATRGRFRV